MSIFAGNHKGAHLNDRGPEVESANILLLQAGTAGEGTNSSVKSHSEYPGIKYWNKQEWRDAENKKKDLSEVTGSRGGGRAAKGENVMMLYMENEDGTPVGVLRSEPTFFFPPYFPMTWGAYPFFPTIL